MKPPKRTSVSTDSIPAASDPPIILKGDTAHIDAIKSWSKVVEAWNASADVLRDVAKAIHETQEDSEKTRMALEKNQKVIMVFGTCMIVIQLAASGLMLLGR